MPRLDQWSLVTVGDRSVLTGEISGDTRFVDGQRIVTSSIEAGPVILGNTLVARTKSGTIYELPIRCCTDIPSEECRKQGPLCQGCPAESDSIPFKLAETVEG